MKGKGFGTVIINIIVLVLLVASGVWLVPKIKAAGVKLASQQAEITAYQQQVTALQQAQTALANVGQAGGVPISEETLQKVIPPHRDYEDLLALVESIAVTSGVVDPIDISITQIKEGAAAKIAETPISLSTRGSYGAIEQLIRNLQGSLRPLAIKSVALSVDDAGIVTALIDAATYTRETTTSAPATDASTTAETSATTGNQAQ